jgi:hypothetical protein
MKKSYIRPAYANAVDGKVLYFPFVCIYNGRIRTNSGSAYNQVEAYIPFPSTAHPLHISARETGIHPHTRTTSSGQKASIASLYTFPVHSGQPSFVKKKRKKIKKDKDGREFINLPVDWKKTREKGKIIYNFNYDTEGYFFGWVWFKRSTRIRHSILWYFKPCRNTSRLLAHYIKADPKYQHIYREWQI